MEKWNISDSEINELENILLPKGSSFADDAKAVIRCWESKDVAACPGSGKTTVLLAKLKILADRMPLANGAGVCVLSHTNVAVNEIKTRLSDCSEKLMSYPNYIGTLQSFVDKFLTLPYIKTTYGRSVQPVDDNTYAKHLSQIIKSKYGVLETFVNKQFTIYSSSFQNDRISFISNLFLDNSSNLCLRSLKGKIIAKNDKQSAKQFYNAKMDLIVSDGLIRYNDTYIYAKAALSVFNDEYLNLFSNRFKYVFIDEYQDCDDDQRSVLDQIFDADRCFLMHIGDPDQAIYNFQGEGIDDWIPNSDHLSIKSSCRFSQEIANALIPLKKDKSVITTAAGNSGIKPVIIVYDDHSIYSVLDQFIIQLKNKKILNANGIYTAIGYVGKKSESGSYIGSYWKEYEATNNSNRNSNYWNYINELCNALSHGKLYQAEAITRKLLCKLFHFAHIVNSDNKKEFTPNSITKTLHEEYWDAYSLTVLELSKLKEINRDSVDGIIHKLLDALFIGEGENSTTIFSKLPPWFLEASSHDSPVSSNQNIYIDPINNCRIRISTIHSVKGQTHDATLYLETTRSNGSDLGRILWCYGIGKQGASPLYDYSRKLAYVGFSRPKKLLCVAMCENTYSKCKDCIEQDIWEVVDIRQSPQKNTNDSSTFNLF
jgi:hypothetical protein